MSSGHHLTMFLATLLLLAIPTPTIGQEHSAETQALEPMVGNWTYDHLDGSTECKRLGDYTVHCFSAWTNAEGAPIEAVFLNRFDPQSEVFRGHRFYNSGYADSGMCWVDGTTWVCVYEQPEGARARITSTISGDSWSYVWHRSVQGGPWEQSSDGSSTRVR